MAALDLGFLLRGAGRALTGYRQGTREREEMERARQVEDAERMFKEWATKQQIERERARDAATVDYQNRTLAQQAARDAATEASRKRDDERLTEEAVARRLGEGYETAIPETAQTAANAALSGLGMGQFGVVRARKSDPRIAEAGGVKFRPEETGDVQYITTGGRMMRRDPQRAANAAAQEKADKLAAQLAAQREPTQWVIDTDREGNRVRVNLRTGETVPLGYQAKETATSIRKNTKEISDMAAISGAIRLAEDAANKIAAARNKSGFFGFAGPVDVTVQKLAQMAQRGDQTALAAMGAYQRLAAPEMNKVIGAAMTPPELQRLRFWLTQLEKAGEEDIARIVDGFLSEAKAIREERLQAMEAMGQDVSGFRAEAAIGNNPFTSDDDALVQRFLEARRKRGGG